MEIKSKALWEILPEMEYFPIRKNCRTAHAVLYYVPKIYLSLWSIWKTRVFFFFFFFFLNYLFIYLFIYFFFGQYFVNVSNSRVDKQRNEPGRWKSRIVAIFLLFLTLLHVLT